MNETKWIGVDPRFADKLDEPSTETVRGVTVSVHISPYDRPQAFRGRYVADRGIFRIEFKYPDEEPGERHRGDDVVSVELGKYSGKLLAIEVAVDQHNLSVVELQVVKALERADETVKRLQKNEPRLNARLNYRAVDEVLQQGKEKPELLVPA